MKTKVDMIGPLDLQDEPKWSQNYAKINHNGYLLLYFWLKPPRRPKGDQWERMGSAKDAIAHTEDEGPAECAERINQ